MCVCIYVGRRRACVCVFFFSSSLRAHPQDTEHLPLGAPGKQAWSRLGGGAEEVAMNGVLFAQTAATVWLWAWCAGVPKLAVCQRIGWIVGTFFVVHATSHKLGQWTSDGKSAFPPCTVDFWLSYRKHLGFDTGNLDLKHNACICAFAQKVFY